MKGISLLYGASILIIGYTVLVVGADESDDLLSKCGISEEKNATLHKCLAYYVQQRDKDMENIRNSAGRRNYFAVQQRFRESLKCFPDGKSKEKMCYIKSVFGNSRPNPPPRGPRPNPPPRGGPRPNPPFRGPRPKMPRKGKDDFSFNAAALYYGFRKNTYTMLRICKVDKETTPSLFKCLAALDPEAKEIIKSMKKDERKAFERMAVLVSKSLPCYKGISADQGKCLLAQNEKLQSNVTQQMHKKAKESAEKCAKCGISEEIIGTVMGCMKPKGELIIQLSFQMFNKPELADKVWDLLQAMKGCVAKYPQVVKCLRTGGFGRPPPRRPERHSMNPFHFENVTNTLLAYIGRKSPAMLKECQVDPRMMPNVFICLKNKYGENPDVGSKDPQKAFIAMMQLMNTSAECFKDVTEVQGICLWKNKQEMEKVVNDNAALLGPIMQKILNKCDATEEMMGCVKSRAEELTKFAEILLTEPSVAPTVWDIGTSLKTCLTRDPTVEKCALKAEGASPKVSPPKRKDFKPSRKLAVNPFIFENVTGALVAYIGRKSTTMLKECKLNPRTMPDIFMCMKEKYDENKDVHSKDPHKSFVGMMKLMNTSAECFMNVSETQGLCLLENKLQMMKTVNVNAVYIGFLAQKILSKCDATDEMASCVKSKTIKLRELANNLLTNPNVAEAVWEIGVSMKTCMDSDPAIKACALNTDVSSPKEGGKPGWRKDNRERSSYHVGKMMLKHMKEKSMAMFAECKLTPKSSPEVFKCLMMKYKESNMTSQEPKEIFVKGMNLMKSSVECFKTASDEQKSCLKEKKEEMKEMFAEKSESMKKIMDRVLKDCGVSEVKTPALIQCYAPKRSQLEKLVPELFKNPDVAGTVWDLMEETKKCFEEAPDVMKCMKEMKNKFWMPETGKGPKPSPNMSIMDKIGMLYEKCGIKPTSSEVFECLQPTTNQFIGLYYRKDMDAAGKMREFSRLQGVAGKCFADEEMKKCMKVGSDYLRKDILQGSQKKSSAGFDPENAVESMDAMYGGCGISMERTPSLKACLDERTKMVMQLQPWLPMSNEVREKLKEEGVKYWKCFEAKHNKQRKCMTKIVDGFRTQGKPAGTESKGATRSLPKNEIEEVINKTKLEVLACSENKCFHNKVEQSVVKLKAYLKKMQTKGRKDSKKGGDDGLRKSTAQETVKALLCLRQEPKQKRLETFKCIKKVMNETSDMAKNILKKLSKGGLKPKNFPKGGLKPKDFPKGGKKPKSFPKGGFMDKKNKMFGKGDKRSGGNRGTKPQKPSRRFRRKRSVEDDQELPPFFDFFDKGQNDDDQTSITVFQLMFNDQSMGQVDELLNLMKDFLSTCTSWAPSPEALENGRIIDHGGLPARPPPSNLFDGPEPKMDAPAMDVEQCQEMFSDISSFAATGHGNFKHMKTISGETHSEHHHSSAMIIAVCTGSVVVGILVLLTIIVIFVARRRCQSSTDRPQPAHPTAPIPNVYATFPEKQIPEAQQPPSYSESLDATKYPPSNTQILSTSAKGEEGNEKSC